MDNNQGRDPSIDELASAKERMEADLERKFAAAFQQDKAESQFITRKDLREAVETILRTGSGDIARQTVDRQDPSARTTLGNQVEPREMTALESAIIEMDDILSVMSDAAARLGDFNDRVSGPRDEADASNGCGASNFAIGHLFARIASMRQLAYRLSGEVYRAQKIG